ncbi:hypothetical protein Adt_14072 [Abeliophyllum distichum]|uniref:Uncharacterized protein n=1 Tax=Abeliophyllum distichum TaxID=126358 RepID=A0ABD1TYL7_9LAMI
MSANCSIKCRVEVNELIVLPLQFRFLGITFFLSIEFQCALSEIQLLRCKIDRIDRKVLYVGKELLKETFPLQMDSRLYELQGLKPHTWYEVKISYPASIPSSFSLHLKRGSSDLGLNWGRKLLNTEKLIFKTDGIDSLVDQHRLHVLVNVEPEGVVAIPGKQESKFVIFNIVCDELFLGIPHKAWYVVFLVFLCLGVAFVVPTFLPPFLLPKNRRPSLIDQFFFLVLVSLCLGQTIRFSAAATNRWCTACLIRADLKQEYKTVVALILANPSGRAFLFASGWWCSTTGGTYNYVDKDPEHGTRNYHLLECDMIQFDGFIQTSTPL